MRVKRIIHKLLNVFSQIVKNKHGLTFLLIFIILQLSLITFIFYHKLITFKGLLGLTLFITFSILISEFILYLLIKYKVTLLRFSSFLDFIYKKKAKEGFPYREIFPDFHYYTYSPFYNFAPKPSCELNLDDIEINSLGFRGKEKDWQNSTNYYIYLSGDCQFFDSHLKLKDTFSHMLEVNMKKKCGEEIAVLNAAGPHYTLLHSLNRLIIDLNRIRFHLIILCEGINDVLVFVHSKNGKAPPDYSNLYKPFNEESILNEFQGPLVRYSKILQLYKYIYMHKRRMLRFDDNIETINPTYNSNENISHTKQLFKTIYFENYLRIYIAICKMFHIPLMLTTANYNPSDMKGPARTFTAYGIDQINLIIKKIADEYSLPVFDHQKEFIPNSSRIFNKWHYTKEGNELRAELISNFIQQHFSLSL